MIFFFDAGRYPGRTLTGAHVDCFALSYCRRGAGTATVDGLSESSADLPRGSLWTDYNPDGSGYPNLEHIVSHDGRDVFAMGLHPRASTADIRPGDTFDVVLDTRTGPLSTPTVLSPYFVTVPAIASYASGGGPPTAVSYPVANASPGTDQSPVQLSSDQLALTFWRPQRAGIAGADPGPFMDMGHLFYGVVPRVQGTSGGGEFGCDGFYSGLSPTLGPAPPSGDSFATALWPLVDGGDDAAPDGGHTLGFTIDLGGCLRAHGIDPAGKAVDLSLTAAGASRPGGADRAVQTFSVRLPG
jgi:hypothetical protein